MSNHERASLSAEWRERPLFPLNRLTLDLRVTLVVLGHAPVVVSQLLLAEKSYPVLIVRNDHKLKVGLAQFLPGLHQGN